MVIKRPEYKDFRYVKYWEWELQQENGRRAHTRHTGEMNYMTELTMETLKMRKNFYFLGRLN